jgi:hypothetical protein
MHFLSFVPPGRGDVRQGVADGTFAEWRRIMEIIEMADRDGLDVLRSRAVEQEVLETLDEPATRPSPA